jgi:rod shape-determining protein MreD
MNPSQRKALWLGISLLIAIILQAAFADKIKFFGLKPDLTLVVALTGAMFCEPNGASFLGFMAGLLHASFAAPAGGGVGAIIVSRTLICFGIGLLGEHLYRDSLRIACLAVTVATLLTEIVFYVIAPQPLVAVWFRHAVGTAVYNALLAVPLYLLLRRTIGRKETDRF